MTVQSRTSLKTFFISGAAPTESNFADLIDSSIIIGDVVNSLDSSSTTLPLSAAGGQLLNERCFDLNERVVILEGASNTFASGYYNKTEIDSKLTDVDAVIANLPYSAQITTLNSDITTITGFLTGKADTSHTQDMSTITGLADALVLKASVTELNYVKDSLIDSINAIVLGTDSSADIAVIQTSLNSINSTIDTLATKLDLDGKADNIHNHPISQITGIDDYYNKSDVDTLVASMGVGTHSHTASDITDLGTEIENKTNLLVTDHSSLSNNPHGVTKEQIGLGNVSNLSPQDIINTAGVATTADISAVNLTISTHSSQDNNPHLVTKDQVGLSNVTNVDVEQLLSDHLNAVNPHQVDLNFFDVYTTAQSDSRMQAHIDSVRYAFTPPTNDDSAGEIGDFAYDSDNIYFKVSNTSWKKSALYPVWSDRGATQDDIDAGNATYLGEILRVNEPPLTGGGSGTSEVFGFHRDVNHNLIMTTTSGGTENIDFTTYDTFQDVIYGNTGFDFNITDGDLISTI